MCCRYYYEDEMRESRALHAWGAQPAEAGYTSGGAPYGITWEEAAAQGLLADEEMEGEY